MPRALVVLRVPVGAVVLAAASGQALAGVEATGQALACVELTLHGEAGSVMRCCSKDNVTMTSYAIRKKFERRCLICLDLMEQDLQEWVQ